MKYRADIDGLRALAVLPVLLFHAELGGFHGGFVGVDVFFVISGFLITANIAQGVDDGGFSIAHFYERRFRRLLPALFLVLLVTGAGAWALLTPSAMVSHGWEVFAASLFSGNLYFWRTVDYFNASDRSLLLHTWSLGVEEQFYLFFPLLLMVLGADRRRRIAVLSVGAVLSLVLAEWAARTHPVAAFYLLPSRAWELLMGSLLALGVAPRMQTRWVREGGALIGLLLILASFWGLDGASRFPGLSALPAVLGTGLILQAGAEGSSAVGRGLSWRWPVFIGKISYSLYLWHWPILLLVEMAVGAGAAVSAGTRIAALLLSGVLAAASWRWVEVPTRKKAATRARVMGAALLGSVVCSLAGAAVVMAEGFPDRWSAAGQELADQGESLPPECFGALPEWEACRVGETAPSVAIWGDSHALAMLPALQYQATANHWGGVSFTKTACPPLMGVGWPDDNRGCVPFNESTLAQLSEREDLRTVVLVARWGLVAHWTQPAQPADLQPFRDHYGASQGSEAVFRAGLERTLDGLIDAGKRVVLIGSVPESLWDVPLTLALHHRLGRPAPVLEPAVVEARGAWVDAEFRRVAAHPRVDYVPTAPLFCAEEAGCRIELEGAPLYRDAHHLNLAGAVDFLGPRLRLEIP